MHKFVRSLITEWRQLDLSVSGETIIVAVSGGADSIGLLLAISDLVKRKKLGHEVIVGHFNHKLRGDESDADEEFVREQSDRLGFQFVDGTARLGKKRNLEQAARDARYRFLSETASQYRAFAVLTGHTRNDQAETFLLNLIRGSGRAGLAAMTPVRRMDENVLLVRPLLSWASRNDTESFCRDNETAFRADQMNDDERFSRVRIRKTVLPLLAELNPRIIETLSQTAELLRIDPEPESPATTPASFPLRLELKALRLLPKGKLYELIRSWLRANRGSLRSLQLKHIEAIERLIASRKSGNTVELPGGGRVVKEGGLLSFAHIKVDK